MSVILFVVTGLVLAHMLAGILGLYWALARLGQVPALLRDGPRFWPVVRGVFRESLTWPWTWRSWYR